MIDYKTSTSSDIAKWIVFGVCFILAIMLLIDRAAAQHNHSAGHADYQSWASKKIGNCCNNQDCGELKDDEWRQTSKGTEVRIDGQWCPVERQHWIIKGKSPDWNKAHACVGSAPYWKEQPPCERLLCFSGPGGV